MSYPEYRAHVIFYGSISSQKHFILFISELDIYIYIYIYIPGIYIYRERYIEIYR